jgi:hypothetical protein
MGLNQDFKLPESDPLEVAPTELPLILETKSYRQVVPSGTSSVNESSLQGLTLLNFCAKLLFY